jgi:peroxiredoxin
MTPLKVGDHAPLFSLPSSLGQPVALATYLDRGPVVLAWYLFDFGRV